MNDQPLYQESMIYDQEFISRVGLFLRCFVYVICWVGGAAGGNTPEAKFERTNPPAGGGKKQLAGAAGGG